MANLIYTTAANRAGYIGHQINTVEWGGYLEPLPANHRYIRAQRVYSATLVCANFNLGRYVRINGYNYQDDPAESFHIYFPLYISARPSGGGSYMVARADWYLDLTHEEYITHGYGYSNGIPNTHTYDLVRYITFTPENDEMEALFKLYINDLYGIGAWSYTPTWDPTTTVDPGFHWVTLPDGTQTYEYINMEFSNGNAQDGPVVPRQLIIDYLPVGALGKPKNVTAPALAAVGGVVISWQAPVNGEELEWPSYITVTKFAIWRAEEVNGVIGNYSKIAETTDGETLAWTDTTAAGGHKYYYCIQAIPGDLYPDYASRLSDPTAGTYVNAAPAVPTFESGADGTTYNSRPRILATLGADADSEVLQLAAAGWTISRDSAAPGQQIVLMRSAAMTAAGSFDVTLSEVDGVGNVASAQGGGDYAVPAWTDVPVVARQTVVKAAHINEIRAQLEALCAYYGMDAPTWASGDVIATVTSKAGFPQHAGELQAVVRAIVQKINGWDPVSSRNNVVLPSLIEPSRPLASVINQLRDIIKIL